MSKVKNFLLDGAAFFGAALVVTGAALLIFRWFVLAGLVVFFLFGCTMPQRKPDVIIQAQRVEIPVAVKCKPSIPEKPVSMYDALPLDAGAVDSIKALISDILADRSYEEQLTAALVACGS